MAVMTRDNYNNCVLKYAVYIVCHCKCTELIEMQIYYIAIILHFHYKQMAVYTGWLLTAGAFAFCIYGTRSFMESSYEYNAAWEIFFATFSRSIWGLAICWIIYACIYDYAGQCWSFFIIIFQLLVNVIHVGGFLYFEIACRVSRFFFSFHFIDQRESSPLQY